MVSRHKEEFGLNRCLRALGVSKGIWHYRQKRDYNTERRHSRLAYQSPLEYLYQEGNPPEPR